MERPIKSRSVPGQFVRYFLVAGVGLGVDFGTIIFTKEILGFHYLIAACSGFILGLVVTYILSNEVVFGTPKGNKHVLFILFTIIGIVGLGILNLLMWLLVSKAGLNYLFAKVLATIVVFMWNFFGRKTLYMDNTQNLPYEL